MEKERRYTVRLPKKDADILEKYCSEQNIPIAEFMRAASLKALPKTWSPVTAEALDPRNNPGISGYDQTKGNWSPELIRDNPEVIRCYADKVKLRQTRK